MKKCKTIFLLRHGMTGLSGKYIGSTNVSLSKEGVEQIKKIAPYIFANRVDKVFCSPKLRCLQTQEQLRLPVPASLEYDLREIDFGRWEGKTFKEIVKSDPDLVEKWSEWSEDFTFPEGENLGDFVKRVEKIKLKILSADEDKILVISHGGVIRSILCSLLGVSQDKYLQYDVAKGAVAVVETYESGNVLKGFNLGQWEK